MAVMLLVLALYKWEELAVYAAVSVAATTPKRSDAEVAHPIKAPAIFSQSPSEVASLMATRPESPADRAQSTVCSSLWLCVELKAKFFMTRIRSLTNHDSV